MASPNILAGIADGGVSAFNSGQQNQRQNALVGMQQEQHQQRNALFQQGQEDRQRQMQQEQEGQEVGRAREALAGYFMTPAEQRGAYYQQVASQFGLPPDGDHAQIVPEVIRRSPGILGPELSAKILEREFAPQQQTGVPGDIQEYRLWEQQGGKGGYAGYMKFKAGLAPQARNDAQKLVALPDPESPTGYSFGTPQPGAPATAPRAVTTTKPGQSAVDKEFAKEYVEFRASGGYADTVKQLQQLNEVLTALEDKDGPNLTGAGLGLVPDFMKAMLAPDALGSRETVEEVVQRNLRLILGAQFTQKEGDRLIARAYNPSLDEAENAKRLRRLIAQIDAAAKTKESASQYFEEHGTLAGWGGQLPKLSDFEDATGQQRAQQSAATNGGFRVIRRK